MRLTHWLFWLLVLAVFAEAAKVSMEAEQGAELESEKRRKKKKKKKKKPQQQPNNDMMDKMRQMMDQLRNNNQQSGPWQPPQSSGTPHSHFQQPNGGRPIFPWKRNSIDPPRVPVPSKPSLFAGKDPNADERYAAQKRATEERYRLRYESQVKKRIQQQQLRRAAIQHQITRAKTATRELMNRKFLVDQRIAEMVKQTEVRISRAKLAALKQKGDFLARRIRRQLNVQDALDNKEREEARIIKQLQRSEKQLREQEQEAFKKKMTNAAAEDRARAERERAAREEAERENKKRVEEEEARRQKQSDEERAWQLERETEMRKEMEKEEISEQERVASAASEQQVDRIATDNEANALGLQADNEELAEKREEEELLKEEQHMEKSANQEYEEEHRKQQEAEANAETARLQAEAEQQERQEEAQAKADLVAEDKKTKQMSLEATLKAVVEGVLPGKAIPANTPPQMVAAAEAVAVPEVAAALDAGKITVQEVAKDVALGLPIVIPPDNATATANASAASAAKPGGAASATSEADKERFARCAAAKASASTSSETAEPFECQIGPKLEPDINELLPVKPQLFRKIEEFNEIRLQDTRKVVLPELDKNLLTQYSELSHAAGLLQKVHNSHLTFRERNSRTCGKPVCDELPNDGMATFPN